MTSQRTPKLRADLQWIAYDAERRWVVCDPVANSFYYLNGQEFKVAKLLDGTKNIEQLQQILQSRNPETPVKLAWVDLLVARLENANLLLPELKRRFPPRGGSTLKAGFLKNSITNPFAIRIPLFQFKQIDPWVRTFAKALFHPLIVLSGLIASLILIGTVGIKTISNQEQISYNMQQIQGDRWLLLIGLYAIIKSLHELGHFLVHQVFQWVMV